jgi:hypothetical protein
VGLAFIPLVAAAVAMWLPARAPGAHAPGAQAPVTA